jgi:hypothetical protein
MTEAELAAMFRNVAIIRDKGSKVSRGSSGSVRPNPRHRGFLPSTPFPSMPAHLSVFFSSSRGSG